MSIGQRKKLLLLVTRDTSPTFYWGSLNQGRLIKSRFTITQNKKFIAAFVLRSLRLIKLKTEGRTIEQKTSTKSYKIIANPRLA